LAAAKREQNLSALQLTAIEDTIQCSTQQTSCIGQRRCRVEFLTRKR
jgi:hypothetical protein